MATFSKIDLSEAVDGMGIAVVATASTGTLIHNMDTDDTADYDEVWLYVTNVHSGDEVLTIQWGTTGGVNDITQTVATKAGLVLVVPGLVLKGNASVQKNIRAFNPSGASSRLIIHGYVNRITG
jgi:hypothetical protein